MSLWVVSVVVLFDFLPLLLLFLFSYDIFTLFRTETGSMWIGHQCARVSIVCQHEIHLAWCRCYRWWDSYSEFFVPLSRHSDRKRWSYRPPCKLVGKLANDNVQYSAVHTYYIQYTIYYIQCTMHNLHMYILFPLPWLISICKWRQFQSELHMSPDFQTPHDPRSGNDCAILIPISLPPLISNRLFVIVMIKLSMSY